MVLISIISLIGFVKNPRTSHFYARTVVHMAKPHYLYDTK
jgi:hypothetical protein